MLTVAVEGGPSAGGIEVAAESDGPAIGPEAEMEAEIG
jgi:hypothetical protein